MKFGRLSDGQRATLVRAMSAVVSAAGAVPPLPLEVESVAAAQRHLLRQDPPLPLTPGKLPADLAEVLADPALRRSTVRLLAALAVIDPAIAPAKVAVVEDAARRLGVSEFGLTLLHRIALGQYRRNGFALMTRFVNHYWSYTGKAGARDWAAMLWPMMPWLPGLRRYLGQDALLARYRALARLPPDTLGYAVHRYYEMNGFPVPGEPKSIPEGWARHEVYHVLANYNTNLQGELLLAGFIGGNTDEMCLDIVLPALVQLHAGKRFVPGPVAEGILRPDDFFRAVARGAAMTVDLLAGWRLWEAAEQRLSDLRARYGIPAFTPEEHARLVAEEALLVAA
ncbi:MAG: hypothetical protein BGO51_05685 [Rhodospirillales bacterium 69-11]|nr:hypothetical protein [Rhodospirillales bacterium]OJW27213.1 MAG: hypothetical protein BGO51_05685 [Rhodospirillales bacterium 69-11]